jgi:hypothetical protein
MQAEGYGVSFGLSYRREVSIASAIETYAHSYCAHYIALRYDFDQKATPQRRLARLTSMR